MAREDEVPDETPTEIEEYEQWLERMHSTIAPRDEKQEPQDQKATVS